MLATRPPATERAALAAARVAIVEEPTTTDVQLTVALGWRLTD